MRATNHLTRAWSLWWARAGVTGNRAVSAVCFIPNKILAVIKNSVVLIFGGALMSPFNEAETLDPESGLERFARLINSPWDLFREDITIGNHSVRIYEWQKAQESTRTFEYAGPQFYGL